MDTVAVIPAAGSGVRMGSDRAKQFIELKKSPILGLTLEHFQKCPLIASIVLVVPADDMEFCKEQIVKRYGLSKVENIVAGGEKRQDSVRLGVEATKGEYGLVMIHDGVRPFVSTTLIEEVISAAQDYRAVITGLPAKETVKEVDESGLVIKTYKREMVWLVQTPQIFRYEDILMVHRRALEEGWEETTDDALLLEKAKIPVKVILGSEINIKITTPTDLDLAYNLMQEGNFRCC